MGFVAHAGSRTAGPCYPDDACERSGRSRRSRGACARRLSHDCPPGNSPGCRVLTGSHAATHAQVPDGDAIILLVEDDPLLRVLSARALRRYGYQVLEAEGGLMLLRGAISVILSAERHNFELGSQVASHGTEKENAL